MGTGEANVDGKVTVRKAPQSAFIGTNAANPQVIAGAKDAIEFKELGETPIQIDAVNVAKFGVDRSTVGSWRRSSSARRRPSSSAPQRNPKGRTSMNTAEWFTTATPEQAQRLAEAWPGVPRTRTR